MPDTLAEGIYFRHPHDGGDAEAFLLRGAEVAAYPLYRASTRAAYGLETYTPDVDADRTLSPAECAAADHRFFRIRSAAWSWRRFPR